MAPNAIRSHCPHCACTCAHAFLTSPETSDSSRDVQLADGMGLVQRQRLICSRCERSWEAAVVPWQQIQQLRAAAQSLDEARRQIAMLRLIMSKDQIRRAEKPQTDTIKLHRAA